MAELKKYLDQTALEALVTQIKAEDAKVLSAAQKYVDEAAYDVSGSAATAESNAKKYADEKVKELADGQVNANKEAIAGVVADYLKGADKTELQGNIDKLEEKVDKNGEDIAAINNETTGILAQAKKYADDEDAKVEGLVSGVSEEVADLAEYVGTFTSTTAKSVVEYINEKTTGIASDSAVSALTDRVTQAEKDIDAIEADYLKAADKTELEGKITAEQQRAEGIEGGLRTDVDVIKGDYLKAEHKTELEGKIDLKSDKTALDAEIERATGVEESLQNQINTIMSNPDAEGAINSINEFENYVKEHGTIADGMRADINKNKDDIAAMDTAYKAADTELSGRIDAHVALDHDFAAADATLKSELEGKINAKADASALTDAIEALEGADEDLAERLDAVEAMLGDGDNTVADMIATAKQEAIDAAAQDAANKDVVVLGSAQDYAKGLNDALAERVAVVEGASATHATKTELEGVSGRVGTLEGKVGTLETDVDAVELLAAANKAAHEANAAAIALKASQADLDLAVGRIAQNESDIAELEGVVADKADTSALNAAIERIAKNETDIAANASAIAKFQPITSDEVNALFA